MNLVSSIIGGVGEVFGLVGNIIGARTERMRIRLERDKLENPFRELKNNLYDDDQTDPLLIYAIVGIVALVIILAVLYLKPKAK
mgnify:CR=1 FL=1